MAGILALIGVVHLTATVIVLTTEMPARLTPLVWAPGAALLAAALLSWLNARGATRARLSHLPEVAPEVRSASVSV